MKSPLIFAFCIMSTVIAVSAQAQTYRWKDSNGRTVISDTPPPVSAKPKLIGGQEAEPSPAAETASQGVKTSTMAEKEMEFKKRQQDAKEKAEKEAKEQAAAAAKRENCERARRNLVALESNQPVAQLEENGQQKVLDTSQREQEIERARKFMAETCNK